MAKTFEVNNLTEALSLADNFKTKGKYNLFRGQAQNWKVVSTVGRLSNKRFEEAKEKIERLYYYFETNTTLKKFKTNIDWFYAVAQHYGIPTNYIDFTSSIDVALFFATNSKSNIIGQKCSIVCLNEDDFDSFVKFTEILYKNDKVLPPYIVKVNVDNLWRLQAQHGCFLFTPYADIELYYDFDKILFPFTQPFQGLTKQEIYPERKSELEILLDHYFNSEKRIAGQQRMQKFADKLKIPVTRIPKADLTRLFKKRQTHKSWYSSNFKKWNFLITEEWKRDDCNNIVKFNFSYKNTKEIQIDLLKSNLSTFFGQNKIDRKSALQFEIISKPKLPKRLSKIINRSCERIWDGTRNLPYTNDEIFYIISTYIYLEIYKTKLDYPPSLSGEELVLLELTNKYGSMTRCNVSPSKIILTFRDDIKNILIDELTINICPEILLHVNTLRLLFDFNKLLKIFKEEMIAYQVLYNSENEHPVIFYSPSQITVMGYA